MEAYVHRQAIVYQTEIPPYHPFCCDTIQRVHTHRQLAFEVFQAEDRECDRDS